MKEYIERAAVLKVLEEYYPGVDERLHIVKDITSIPTADVAEVVRCRECKYARESEEAFDLDGETPLCECAYMTQPNRWNEFCSWGKRKEAAHD